MSLWNRSSDVGLKTVAGLHVVHIPYNACLPTLSRFATATRTQCFAILGRHATTYHPLSFHHKLLSITSIASRPWRTALLNISSISTSNNNHGHLAGYPNKIASIIDAERDEPLLPQGSEGQRGSRSMAIRILIIACNICKPRKQQNSN